MTEDLPGEHEHAGDRPLGEAGDAQLSHDAGHVIGRDVVEAPAPKTLAQVVVDGAGVGDAGVRPQRGNGAGEPHVRRLLEAQAGIGADALATIATRLLSQGWPEKGRIPYVAKQRHKNKGESRMWNAILNRVVKRPALSAILAGGLLVAMSLLRARASAQASRWSPSPASQPLARRP